MIDIQPGYKQTGVGVIPENWEVKAFSHVAPLQRGFDLPTPQLRSGPFPVVYSNGVLNYHYKPMVTGPGVVTGRSGTIGKVNFIESDYWPHNTTLWVTSFKGNAPKFIYYLYQNIGLGRYGTGSGVPTLNRNDVHAFLVPMPPLHEQEAIAEALSDADALIESLEQLITKKRQIKQGAMQELLTGKKRLPGFQVKAGYKQTEVGVIPEDWIAKNLGDVCQIFGRIGFRGYKVSDIVQKGAGAIAISPSNIRDSKMDLINCTYISWVKYEESPEIKLFNGDILLVKTGSTFGKTAIVQNLEEKATLNPQLVVLKNVEINNFYLAYMMGFTTIQEQISEFIVGGALPTLSQKLVVRFKFPIPPTKAEQEAIAAILSDMDSEIAALETKLAKTRSLKLGMMHNLLTGRIRLL